MHGSGPQPPRGQLKVALDSALFGSDQGDRTAVAYYADILHPIPVVEALRVAIDMAAALPREARDGPEQVGGRAARSAAPRTAVAAAFARRTGLAMTARLTGTALRRPAPNAAREGFVPRTLRAIVLRFVLRFFLRDAHRYFFEGAGARIRARVAELLSQAPGPLVVIGHSLGSIVAYDTLAERAAASPELRLFVTLGSPLGIDAVKELVHQPPAVPPGVARWLNVADPLDVVAADPILGNDYAPPERVADAIVDNGAFNPHDLAGYLRTAEVRDAVRRGLEIQPV